MLIDCICGESKFAINAEQIGFDGRLVKCGKCGKEWFHESNLEVIEKQLANLDQSLHSKEIKLGDERNYYSDKISFLEKDLKSKNAEILNQKKLEERLKLFETRVQDSEAEIIRQKRHEERIGTLQKELEKKTLDLFIKGAALEKRSKALQEQLDEKTFDERLSSLEQELITKTVGGKVIQTKKPIEVFNVEKNIAPQPFEIDKIEIENPQPNEKKESFSSAHNDDEETARIGRSGDPLKVKKVK